MDRTVEQWHADNTALYETGEKFNSEKTCENALTFLMAYIKWNGGWPGNNEFWIELNEILITGLIARAESVEKEGGNLKRNLLELAGQWEEQTKLVIKLEGKIPPVSVERNVCRAELLEVLGGNLESIEQTESYEYLLSYKRKLEQERNSALARVEELEECKDSLSTCSSYLGCGLGDDKTTISDYCKRICEGVDSNGKVIATLIAGKDRRIAELEAIFPEVIDMAEAWESSDGEPAAGLVRRLHALATNKRNAELEEKLANEEGAGDERD